MRNGDVLTPQQVAELLQVPVKTVIQLCARGAIPLARKVGRRRRMPRRGLDLMFNVEEEVPIVNPCKTEGQERRIEMGGGDPIPERRDRQAQGIRLSRYQSRSEDVRGQNEDRIG